MVRPSRLTSSSQLAPSQHRRRVSPSDDESSDDTEDERRTKPKISRNVKQERAEARRRDSPPSDEEQEDEDEEEEAEEEEDAVPDVYRGWNVDEYEPKPVTKDPEGLIGKAISAVKLVSDDLSKAMGCAQKVACAYEEMKEDAREVSDVEKGYLRCLDRKMILLIRLNALDSVSKRLRRAEPIADPMEAYEAICKPLEEDWNARTLRQKFKDNEDYKSFRQAIWDCHHENQPCPSMNDFLPAQPGDEDDDDSDDEVQIGVQRQDFVDPITLRPIEDAVVVPECGHHYSRASIMGMIEQQKGKRKTTAGIHIKCPRPSCHVKVSEHDIKRDPDFQARVDAHYARQTQRKNRAEAEGETEEVVDVEEDDYDEE